MSDTKPLFIALGLPDVPAVMVLRGLVTNMNGGVIPESVAAKISEHAGKTDWDLAILIAKDLCGVVTQEKKKWFTV